ncbi:hypothetical protein HGB07_05205, partial [Candidatus Roizmanbacteria bacterium]|nr:hypothetical protein [Candidatus Roizmanbacteria bacterium]
DLGVVPSESELDEVGEVDILIVPVGGKFTLDSTDAITLIKKVEPSLVIPMHYKNPALNQEQFGDLAPVDEFITKIGATVEPPVQKLSIKKEDLSDTMRVVVMEATT